MAWRDDLTTSINTFDRLILPILPRLVSGDFIRVEGRPEEIAQYLDQSIGIDAMIDKGGITYGLGSRIQIDTGVWDDFTIRCDRQSGHITELEKLRNAIKYDAMRPHLTMQAFVKNDELKSIGMARTRDIIDYIDGHECKTQWSHDDHGWAQFVIVDWDDMKKAGYKVNTLKWGR